MLNRLYFKFCTLLLCLVSLNSLAFDLSQLDDEPEFLHVDQAFQFNFEQVGDQLNLTWDIADGYYLYKDKTKAKTDTEKLSINFALPGKDKQDEYFGLVKVYTHKLDASISIASITADKILVTYQGCADAGLCYPPKLIDVPLTQVSTAATAETTSELASQANQSDLSSGYFDQQSFWLTLGSFLLLGIGLSLTPCVLPMVPILSTIITGQKETSVKKGLLLSVAYVLGMASFYTLSGILVGYFGASFNLQLHLQNPVVVVVFSAIFVALAFAMFGFYELALPASVQDKLQQSGNGKNGLISTYLAGGISALALSPCVSAPLASALVYISTTGDALLGGAALFTLSIGMGLPLILVGAGFAGYLPQTGAWMIRIKQLFGVIMLGMAIWMLGRLFTPLIEAMMWAALAIWLAVQLDLLNPQQTSAGKNKQAVALVILVSALAWLGHQYLQLNGFQQAGITNTQQSLVKRLDTVATLEQAIKAENKKKVVVDLYADWCASCQVIEHEVFAKVNQADYPNHIFLQLDLTDMTTAQQDFLTQHKLFGPPALLIFDTEKSHAQADFVFQAEFNLEQFTSWLK
ncbi:protein-disulfide reductase DsbD [Catenovulum maritimum]|uniref:protein-disulfide reductase DsbD n=1 Tax=Catenovulum maritimum TaxID=1513271 RepID=UPI00065F8EB4|nr:protein-disulfide reductase DsbD [Catenovulum maritimum]